MKRYLLLFEAPQPGCDYSIACGKAWEYVNVHKFEDLEAIIRKRAIEHGGEEEPENVLEKVTVHELNEMEVVFDIESMFREDKLSIKQAKIEAEKDALRKRLKELGD